MATAYLRKGRAPVYDWVVKRLLSALTGVSPRGVETFTKNSRQELGSFRSKLLTEMRDVGKHLNESDLWQVEALYFAVRLLRPLAVVETGVGWGLSSSYMLLALEANQKGTLHSVDLPNYDNELLRKGIYKAATPLPSHKEAGWLIPSELRPRWNLSLGLVSDVLPRLLQGLGSVDMFYHDSEHTYENMTFEYNLAWPHLSKGGVLLSDDTAWNRAFYDFCTSVSKKPALSFWTPELRSFNGVAK